MAKTIQDLMLDYYRGVTGMPNASLNDAMFAFFSGTGIGNLDNGESNIPRINVNSGGVAPPSGTIAGSLLLATKTETISLITVNVGSVAAAPTPTLIKLGVYEVVAPNLANLVAASANNTGLFASTFALVNVSLVTPFVKKAGTKYGIAYLITTPAAVPSFYGASQIANFNNLSPRLIFSLAGQVDLPATLDPSVGGLGSMMWTALIP